MKWFIGLVGLVICIKGGMDLGLVISDSGAHPAGNASFIYDEASYQDRSDWLNGVAEKLEKRAKREAGASMYVSYKETLVRPGAKEVQTVLKLNSMYEFRLDSKTLREGLEAACPHYVRLGLYANDITWTQKMVKNNGQVVLNLPITPKSCRRYVDAAA